MPATTRGPKLHCPRAQQLLRTIPARVPFSTSLTMAPVMQCEFFYQIGFVLLRKNKETSVSSLTMALSGIVICVLSQQCPGRM